MRFTSLIVELLRARPLLMFWLVASLLAVLWLAVPAILFASPPGEIADILAVGREYRLGATGGPPLAYWIADVAFRLVGNHVFGVYLLSQVCFVAAFRTLYSLCDEIAGEQHAILAVLISAAIAAFGISGISFGPAVLALPLWALALLYTWRIIGEGQRNAWFGLSIVIGLLGLTTSSALVLSIMLLIFALATQRGRQALHSFDSIYAAFFIAVVLAPYLVWLARSGSDVLPSLPATADLLPRTLQWGELLGLLLLSATGVAILVTLNSRRFNPKPEEAPSLLRPLLDPLARQFVYTFALAPPLALSFLGALFGDLQVLGGAGIALLMCGPAVVIAAGELIYLRRQRVLRTAWLVIVLIPALFLVGQTMFQPWIADAEANTSLPASSMGTFFGDAYQRRFGRSLPAVAGDRQLATTIAFAAKDRPRVLFDEAKENAWFSPAQFSKSGGVVVWRTKDTRGAPPENLLARFPELRPEIPQAFNRLVNGRLGPVRVGWALLPPS